MTQRAVLVTGAARGIGRAIAMAFADRGDRVAVHYRQSADAARATVAALPGTGHVALPADLTDPEAVRVLVDRAAAELGGLDVLVNNAGIFPAHPILATSYQDWQAAWRTTVDANLMSVANAIWCAVPYLRERGGRIVNVSSRGAFRGEPDMPAYGASKAALNSMTQSLAVALAPQGIAVSAVAPGFVDTEMVASYLEGASGEAIRAQSPFRRVGRSEEVAAAVLWLASPEAEWASGAIVDLNGASYLRT